MYALKNDNQHDNNGKMEEHTGYQSHQHMVLYETLTLTNVD